MRTTLFSTALACVALASAAVLSQPSNSQTATERTSLRSPSSFDAIADPRARSIALFNEAGRVLLSPRCLNCHPAGEGPTQTDIMQPHSPRVVRGADGHGAPAMRCGTCHHAANFDPANIPGHNEWHLAPLAMAWQGKSLGEICEQIKDRSRNGNRDMAALIHHMSEDTLVGWAWHPGGDRKPAPGTQAEFGALIKAWADTGGACP
jgi:hypothetical protein